MLCLRDVIDSFSRYFMNQLPQMHLAPKQACVLVGLGLQRNTVEEVAKGLEIPGEQVLGLFKKAMRKFSNALTALQVRGARHVYGVYVCSWCSCNPCISKRTLDWYLCLVPTE